MTGYVFWSSLVGVFAIPSAGFCFWMAWRTGHSSKSVPLQTHLEYERDLYARDAITLEEFEFRAGELIELGYADKCRVFPIQYTRPSALAADSALKELYRGPICDIPKAPMVMGRPSPRHHSYWNRSI